MPLRLRAFVPLLLAMALIKHANAKELTKGAIVLDLGDLRRQGEAIIQRAREQAAAIVREAEAERDRLVAGAAERGYAEGLARGLEEGRARGREEGHAEAMEAARQHAEALCASWEAALAEFTERREAMLLEARMDVLRLAVLIAEKVTKRVVRIDPEVAAAQVESVLGLIARPTEVVLSINPEDRAVVERVLPGVMARLGTVRGVELRDDANLERGSCVARMRGNDGVGGGEIDASISTQLDRIVSALLPGEERGSSAGEPAGGAGP